LNVSGVANARDAIAPPKNKIGATLSRRFLNSGFVMRGLDPRIHLLKAESFQRDGLPGQARQ